MARRFSTEELRSAGLLARSGNFLFWRHTLLFFYMHDGEPRFIQARDVTGTAHTKELSLAGLVSPVPFNVDVLETAANRVHVCEGCVDTLSAVELGFPAVGIPVPAGFAGSGSRSSKTFGMF